MKIEKGTLIFNKFSFNSGMTNNSKTVYCFFINFFFEECNDICRELSYEVFDNHLTIDEYSTKENSDEHSIFDKNVKFYHNGEKLQ